MLRVCVFAHDLGDPAIHRRLRMLQEGGATISLAGFRRTTTPPASIEGVRPVDLGRTEDSRLLRRVGSVALAGARLARLRRATIGADVIVARQLEMLLLASLARRLFAPRAALVFECLDVHRAMLGNRGAATVLRWLEARLLRRCALLIVSSPAFVSQHFRRYATCPPVRLVENRALASEAPSTRSARPAPIEGPWRIGWFGVIRCARSLSLLAALARPGRVEVIIRGRPAYSAIPDFDRIVTSTPGLDYRGPYDRRIDLARIYSEVHFCWTMDFFEAGMNSDWLLPNRLYEGGLHGSVALCQRTVQSGIWLAQRSAGVLLEEPLDRSLATFFAGLQPAQYDDAARATAAIPLGDLVADAAECRGLVDALRPRPRSG